MTDFGKEFAVRRSHFGGGPNEALELRMDWKKLMEWAARIAEKIGAEGIARERVRMEAGE